MKPEAFRDTWNTWLENIQPWCISRQLVWGHRIPVYRCEHVSFESPIYIAGMDVFDVRRSLAIIDEEVAKTARITQDADVLDTWFSSALYPFAALGWPTKTPDFQKFFPNSILETGSDILFFWVARMVMLSYALTDQKPFSQIWLHPMVRDKQGKKMSKSKGNVIDPMDLIQGRSLEELLKNRPSGLTPQELRVYESTTKKNFPDGIPECGADALRFALLGYMQQGSQTTLIHSHS